MASLSIGFVLFISKNKVDFVNLSTIIQTTSFLFMLFESTKTKSIVIFLHFHYGIERNRSLLRAFYVVLTC